MPGFSYWNSIRRQALIRDCFECQACGSDKRLAVHHKDGSGDNWKQKTSNNQLENLVTLCNSCHLKEHWKKAKTIGNNLFEQIKNKK